MKQRTFDFTEPQLARLMAEAERSGQGQAEIVRAALEMLFASRFTPYPTSRATSRAVANAKDGHQQGHQHSHQPGSAGEGVGGGESFLGGGTEQVEQQQGQGIVSPEVQVEAPPERRRKSRRGEDLLFDPPGFAEFWAEYPKKQKRGDARKAWFQVAKILPPLPDLLAAITRQRYTPQWQREAGQYIPLPASWLRGECWTDEGADVLAFTPAADPEIAWRVNEIWSDRVYAYREFQRQHVGVAPSVDPVLTPTLRALVEQAIRTFDGCLEPHNREAWRARSIARAAGIGHFYSAWHIGEDPKSPGLKQLGHDLPWRNGNTQRFADLYFENRDITEAAERARR